MPKKPQIFRYKRACCFVDVWLRWVNESLGSFKSQCEANLIILAMNSVHWFHRTKSLPLHRAPCMSLSVFFFCVWESVRTHPYILLEQRKFIQDEDLYNFHVSSDRPEWTANRRKILDLFIWHWLGVTDYFRAQQRSLGQEGQCSRWLMKQWHWHQECSTQTNRRYIAELTSDPKY